MIICLDNKFFKYIYYVLILVLVIVKFFVFIGVYCSLYFIEVECIYFNCISPVFIEHIFISVFIYLFIFIGLDLIFFSQYMCYKIY